MKILVLANDLPATSRMPGSPRLFNLCRELAREYELILVACHASEERRRAFRADPDSATVFPRVEILGEPGRPSFWGRQRHRLRNAAHFETRFAHPAYFRDTQSFLKALCRSEGVGLILVDLLAPTQYVDPGWGIPAIVDLHDSATHLATRLLRQAVGMRARFEARKSLASVRRLELGLGRVFEWVVLNSPVDEDVLKRVCPGLKTRTIPNGVDMEFFSPDETKVDADKVVFTGVMGYSPNEGAAVHFAREILPLVREQRPGTQFWIVGSDPPESVRALASTPGVHVTGQVEDVRPHVRSAAVFVCPLRVGSGVKNKLLAAMAMEKAIVATPLSIEGLDVVDGRELALADAPADFAEKVVRLLEDEDEAARLGANGLACVRRQYSWNAMGEDLAQIVRSIVR